MGDFFSSRSSGGLAGGMSNTVKMAAVALLVQQLMKHARNDTARTPASDNTAQASGGLGGILGGLLNGGSSPTASGTAGGGLGGLLSGGGLGELLGGLGGMLSSLRGQGMGQQVDSWIVPGPNQQIFAQDLERGFDAQELDEAARQAGTDRKSVLEELSSLLPQFVDRATPGGSVPQREEELGQSGLGGLLEGLLGGDAGQQAGGNAGRAPTPRS